ncbi:MAG: tetratricopeptide repeat protein [Proteobacteria bacterium]|nr:tetratricopeptide repeat protein [Pseudomonadota bacterium]
MKAEIIEHSSSGGAPPPTVSAPAPGLRRAEAAPAAQAGKDLIETGLAHHRSGDLAKAETAYKRHLRKHPRDPGALQLLGLIAHERGRTSRALQLIGKAIAEAPGDANLHHVKGYVLQGAGRLEEAAESYAQALALMPDAALSHTNLGNVLKGLGRYDEAVTHHRRAVAIDPAFAEAWSNLGLTHKARRDRDAAFESFERALALKPDNAEFHYNFANALLMSGRTAEAAESFARTVTLAPGHVRAHANLGVALKEEGRMNDAIASLRTAIALDPAYADGHWNLGLALLLDGRFEEGWREYEWRRKIPEIGVRSFDAPAWDGAPFEGKTLLIHAEQGLGDALQFIRYAPLAKEKGGTVVFECPAPLMKIAESAPGIDRLTARGDAPVPFDIEIPLISLPAVLGTTAETVPADIPYLAADAALSAAWKERLGGGFNIGIAWQGNPSYKADGRRSIPLAHFAALTGIGGPKFISLQKGPGAEQLQGFAAGSAITDPGADFDEANGAFMDSAAVIANLDLVITSDSAIAHLAGALGRETWMALPHIPDWRWGLEGETTPWYPTLRLFRQSRAGDWDTVFARLAEALAARLEAGN